MALRTILIFNVTAFSLFGFGCSNAQQEVETQFKDACVDLMVRHSADSLGELGFYERQLLNTDAENQELCNCMFRSFRPNASDDELRRFTLLLGRIEPNMAPGEEDKIAFEYFTEEELIRISQDDDGSCVADRLKEFEEYLQEAETPE